MAARCRSLPWRELLRHRMAACGAPDAVSSIPHPARRWFHSSPVVAGKPKLGPSGFMPASRSRNRQDQARTAPVDAPFVAAASSPCVLTLPPVELYDGLTVAQLAERLGFTLEAVQAMLAGLGEAVVSATQPVSIEAAELVALEVDRDVKRVRAPIGANCIEGNEGKGSFQQRPPVVTVMGHVDHGKTSLLDALRRTSLAASEAGGITQHLGAFVVRMESGASITFLDTPGHAAFSSMRARGAAVTDIVVLVVAADDGVMPQTREALAHALAANVPIVVAINKCDKPDADPAKVRQQLIAEGLELEDLGGDVQVVEISATQRLGLERLEEALLLQAELMDLLANPEADVHAVVVEARVDRGQGPLATAIVKCGSLAPGLHIVVGTQWGRIRTLRDMSGKPVSVAGPSCPVEILGLRGLPEAGDEVAAVANEDRARKLSQLRLLRTEQERHRKLSQQRSAAAGAAEELNSEKVEMPLVVKADVQGTAEAVSQALAGLSSPQVAVSILHAGVGPVSQSDVDLAEACGACVVGFNVRNMASSVVAAARRAKITVRQHRVIYHLLEDIGSLIVSKAPGTIETQISGHAEVLSIFEIKGKGREGKGAAKIAGCRVLDGRMIRSCRIRVLRRGDTLHEGVCQSLRKEKLDVEVVGKGSECGMVLKDWVDFEVGDVVQCVEDIRRLPKFISSQSGSAHIEC